VTRNVYTLHSTIKNSDLQLAVFDKEFQTLTTRWVKKVVYPVPATGSRSPGIAYGSQL